MNANYGYIDQLSSNSIYTNSLQADSISLTPWANGGIDLGSYAFADGYTSLNGPPMAIDHYRDESGKDFYVVRETHEVYEQLSDGIKRSSVDINDLTWIQSGEMSTYVSGGGGQAIERKVTQEAVTYGEKQESFSQADAQFNFAGSSYTASILDDTSTTSTNNELVSGVIRPYTSNLDEKYGVRATSSKDGQVVAETVLTSSGLTTTGQVQAKTMLLDGEDLKTKIEQGDQNTLLAANTYTQNQVTQASENTLKAAKAEDVKVVASANQYTDTQIGMLNSNVSRLNQRIDDVKDTAYRGIAIALAAQQQIPNIGAGQMAVFGGVGHYEGETAGALGLAGVLRNGRTSLSAAFGAAGQGEVGGRVGVAYVFGAK